ncbi:MAG: hypothetical protein G3M70_07750 [Candidatus Nitronauta litoralis]|uniref:DUF7948 domain-containing protein n=1 Tax=Candidatus Nitronauta litoralis TaxID=2705533 RepID=A0A7T0BVL4_9BACT|nr:MAG: hypothetical protein G3M70_07750 [Candidatus Nitronauta litoralis]
MLRSHLLKLTLTVSILCIATFSIASPNNSNRLDLKDALELGLKSPGKVIDLAPYRDPSRAIPKKGEVDAKTRMQVDKSFGRMPLLFEKNEGQVSDQVKFLSRGRGYNFYLTPTESVMVLSKAVEDKTTATNVSRKSDPLNRLASLENPPKMERAVVRMQVVGANDKAVIKGEEKLASTSNYFIGNDQSKWRQGVANYKKVHYEDVYEGIDLVYYGNQNKLEYDFIVKPGANPNNIELKFSGADKVSLDDQGNLVLQTNVGDVVQHAPIIYQIINGKRETVKGEYILKQNNRVAFHITSYNPDHNLVIDPVLGFSTYFGGSGKDLSWSIAADENNNIYVTGNSSSPDFPTLSSIPGGTNVGTIFLFKIHHQNGIPSLAYSVLLGGLQDDRGDGIDLDSLGNVYIAGFTESTNFPLVNEIEGDSTGLDAFIVKLEEINEIPSLAFSTYLGGSVGDGASDIKIGNFGDIFITGWTSSSDFDTKNSIKTHSGGFDVFVLKIQETNGNFNLAYSTLLGGSGLDVPSKLAVDNLNQVYVAGRTGSTNFDLLNEIEGDSEDGLDDMFVFKLEETNNIPSLVYSTYLGGKGDDRAWSITADNFNNVFVTGYASQDFNTVNPLQENHPGYDGIFFKLEETNGVPELAFSTYLGGVNGGAAYGICRDSNKNIYLVGISVGDGFIQVNPIAPFAEIDDIFVMKLRERSNDFSVLYSTYIGGNNSEYAIGCSADSSGNVYVSGATLSSDFLTKNSLQSFNGDFDIIAFKLSDPVLPNLTNDFNNNESSDILATHSSGILVSALIENSVFEDLGFLLQADPAAGWTVNATGDFNGDKKADLLLYNTTTGEYRTVLLDGTSVLSDTVVFTIDPVIGVEPRGVGDFDGDGEAEIIIYHPPSGFTGLVYLVNGAFSSFEEATTIDVAGNWTLQDTGYFNGDNKTDLLISNTVTGESAVIEMDGSTATGPTSIFTFDPATGWSEIDTGDFNGDGKSDVLILHSTGALGVLVMDDLVFQSFYVPGGLSPGWELVNVGNYDGINKADFLIHDTNTGDLMTAVQDGTTVTTYTPVLNLGVGSGWSYHGGKP